MTIVTKGSAYDAIVSASIRESLIDDLAPLGWGPGRISPPQLSGQLCTIRGRRQRDSVTVFVARQGRRGGLAWTPWIGDARLVTAGPRARMLFDDALDHAFDLEDVELIDVSVVGGQVRAMAA